MTVAESNRLRTRKAEDRFWEKTKPGPGGCVLWTAATTFGYGIFDSTRAHRWIYERCLGPLGSKSLLHSCDVRNCVALQHLSPGDHSQNAKEAVDRGLNPVGSRHPNSKLTSHDVMTIRQRAFNGDSAKQIARDLGLCRRTVRSIILHESWRHLP